MTALPVSVEPRSVLAIGYVVLDVLIHPGGVGHSAGGTAGNVASNLSYFGWEASVAAQYGDDPAGSHLKADLVRAGVSTRGLVRRTDLATPVVIHEVKNGAHRFKFGCPECGRKFSQFRAVSRDFAASFGARENPDVLFLDRVSSAAVLISERVRESGGLVFFEPSMPADSPRFRQLLSTAHVIKFSTERMAPDDSLLLGLDALQIYTDGANGAFWRHGSGNWNHVGGYQTNVVDAGGAGDWTTAALLSHMPSVKPADVTKLDPSEPLKFAQAVAALSCESLGARGMSSALSREQLLHRVSQLRGEPRTPVQSKPHRPSRSRRAATCTACLSS